MEDREMVRRREIVARQRERQKIGEMECVFFWMRRQSLKSQPWLLHRAAIIIMGTEENMTAKAAD
jgi:hypothetical protein